MPTKEEKEILSEIESLKDEIEQIKIILDKNNFIKDAKNKGFNFDKYKKEVDYNDLKKLDNFKKIKWYWFIPIIGYFWFLAELSINIERIDRGLVKSELMRVNWMFIIIGFIVNIISVVINIYPFYVIFFIRKIVKKNVLKKINNDEVN